MRRLMLLHHGVLVGHERSTAIVFLFVTLRYSRRHMYLCRHRSRGDGLLLPSSQGGGGMANHFPLSLLWHWHGCWPLRIIVLFVIMTTHSRGVLLLIKTTPAAAATATAVVRAAGRYRPMSLVGRGYGR